MDCSGGRYVDMDMDMEETRCCCLRSLSEEVKRVEERFGTVVGRVESFSGADHFQVE